MERIKYILRFIDATHYVLRYGENKVEISQDDLLQEFENGLYFIDYLADFYYVQDIYDSVKSYGFNEEWKVNPELDANHRTYYNALLFIRYFIINLKDSLKVIGKNENADAIFRKIAEEEKNLLDKFYLEKNKKDFLNEQNFTVQGLFIKNIDKTRESIMKILWIDILMSIITERFICNYTGSLEDFLLDFEGKLYRTLYYFRDSVTRWNPKGNQKNLYYQHAWWFENQIDKFNFANTIESLSATNKRKLKCYAVLILQGEKYYSINGIDDTGKFDSIHKVFEQLLQPEYEGVRIFDGVRYYLDDKKEFITYKHFKQEGINKKENRMFTCCERKLFAKMRKEKKFERAKLIVTSPPCEYCSREIHYIQKNYNKILKLIYPQPEHIYQHDKIAIGIWDKNN